MGTFVDNYHGVAMTTTNEAWADEIRIMQEVLLPWKDEDGQVIFEYDIPRLGKRIDVVLLLRGLIFCLEFKTRQEAKKENMQSYIEQVSAMRPTLSRSRPSTPIASICWGVSATSKMPKTLSRGLPG